MEYEFRKWDFIKYKGSICQIITISEEADDAFIWFADDELTEHVKYSELEYLPVSESILGRFGFSKVERALIFFEKEIGSGFVSVMHFDDGTWNVHIDDDHRMTIGGANVEYVSDMQHIVSLCLNEYMSFAPDDFSFLNRINFIEYE